MRFVFAIPVLVANCQTCGSSGSTLARIDDTSFVIEAGDHDSSPGGIKEMRVQDHLDRFVTFQAKFHADAAYLSVDPVNQFDWNKLMGITVTDVHDDSVRIGWRYVPSTDRISLGIYAYVDGARLSQELTTVALDEWFDASLEMSEDTVRAEVNGVAWEYAGTGDDGTRTTWVLRTAYFGGDEVAPHDIHIDVRDAFTDP